MAPLINRITNALSDATALQELFPEILSSQSPDYYLGNAFVQAAAGGYTKSYTLTAHEVFKHAEKHDRDTQTALTCAIDNRHTEIANDLLNHVFSSFHGLERRNILHFALRSAARCNNTTISERILSTEESSTSFYDAPLQIASCAGNEDIVSLIVKSLMTKTKEFDVQVVQLSRGRVLEHALEESIKKKFHSITAIALVPYLECAASSPRLERARQIVMRIDDEGYAKVPRQESLTLISAAIPTEAKRSLLRRLGSNSETEPRDIHLSVGSQHFSAHKDILSFWSPFFKAMFRGIWIDRDKVAFDESVVSSAALKNVIEFVYSGEYIYPEPGVSAEEQVDRLVALRVAADFLYIGALQQKVEDYLGQGDKV